MRLFVPSCRERHRKRRKQQNVDARHAAKAELTKLKGTIDENGFDDHDVLLAEPGLTPDYKRRRPCPDWRKIEAWLDRHIGQPWSDVRATLRERAGRMAWVIMPEADHQVEGTVIISGSGSIYAHSSFQIDKNGLLQRNENETSHQRSWSPSTRTTRKDWTKSDADLWLNGRIVIEIGTHRFWGIPTRQLSGFRQGPRLSRKEEKLLLSSSFLRHHATDSKARLQELINARSDAIRQALDKMRQVSLVA